MSDYAWAGCDGIHTNTTLRCCRQSFEFATTGTVRGKVFTVIAGDSWNTIMYRTMENTNAVSSLFFVALIVLGEVGGRDEPRSKFSSALSP